MNTYLTKTVVDVVRQRFVHAHVTGIILVLLCLLPIRAESYQTSGLFHNLEEELVLRENGEWIIGQVGDILADNSGHIYVSDEHYQHIKVFGPEGALLRSIGRQGRGPGEFGDIVSVDLWKGQLLVLDRTGNKVSWMDTRTGKVLDEITITSQNVHGDNGTPNQVLALGDSLVGIVFHSPASPTEPDGEHPDFLVTYNRRGEVQSVPLLSGRGSEVLAIADSSSSWSVMPRPFGRKSLFRRGPDGSVYYCWTGEMVIRRYNPYTGESLGAIKQKFKSSPVFPWQVDSVRNVYPGRGFSEALEANLHTHWPALEQFVVDERNRIWVQFRAGDRQYRNLWAFDRSGPFLNIIDHNVHGRVSVVRYGKVYSLHRDEYGRPVIRRFGIADGLN